MGGECNAFPIVEVGDECVDGLHILRSWAFGVVVVGLVFVWEVTVDVHLDVLRFLRFPLERKSLFVSGNFCLSSFFGFINLELGATVISGVGDFLSTLNSFSGFGSKTISKFGDLDVSDVGDAERLLQFFNHRSGVIRFDVDDEPTR